MRAHVGQSMPESCRVQTCAHAPVEASLDPVPTAGLAIVANDAAQGGSHPPSLAHRRHHDIAKAQPGPFALELVCKRVGVPARDEATWG